MPSNLAYTSETIDYTMGVSISDNAPSSEGGDVVSYAITPALPAGLTFSTSTGVISGTPSALSTTPVEYTVTATNSGGQDTTTVTISVIAGEWVFFIDFEESPA